MMMNRSRKTKILTQLFGGELSLLRAMKSEHAQQRRALTQTDLDAMTDAQLTALIESETGQPCPDFDAMTDEQLNEIIAKAYL